MTLRVRAALATLVTVSVSVPAASALPVIDDFETGSFSLHAALGEPDTVTVAVVSPGDAVAPFRTAILTCSGSGTDDAQLDAGTLPDDEVQMVMPPAGGALELVWLPEPVADLTDGGLDDRIDATFTMAPRGAVLQAVLLDDLGGSASAGTTVPGPGVTSLPLTSFVGVDPTRVQQIVVTLTMPAGEFHLSDLRAAGAGSLPVGLDAVVTLASGPPYPAAPLTFDVTDDAGAALETMAIALAEVHLPPGPCLPPNPCTEEAVLADGSDSGGGVGVPGTSGDATLFWNDPNPWADSFFDLTFAFHPPSPNEPVELTALPSVVASPTGFALQYEVWHRDRTGQVVSVSTEQAAFALPSAQGLEVQDVMVPPSPAGAAPLTGFDVTFDLIQTGFFDAASPLIGATLSGAAAAAVGTASPLAAAAPEAELRAEPSVTRGGTRLVVARPAADASRIGIFDVAGRLVRTLEMAPGATATTWDGRDGDGEDVAAGVYLARLEGERRAGTVRVIRLR